MKSSPFYRILMFAPAFAPFANPEAIVNSKLALAFQQAGWEIDIISRKLSGNSSYDYGTEWIDPWIPLRDFTHEITYDVGSMIPRVRDTGWSSLRLGYFIDGCRWATRALDLGLSLHKRNPYHVILSRCFPYSAHLPAMKMARNTGLPWIANWNDPWEFMASGKVLSDSLTDYIGFINSCFCKSVGKHASLHSFPSDKLRISMCRYLGDSVLAKSVTIPHIALPYFKRVPSRRDGTFRICYSGRLWPSRDPRLFLQAIKQIIDQNKGGRNIKFVFMGIDNAGLRNVARDLGIEWSIEELGKLSYFAALQRASECDVLLVLDPPSADSLILTCKFVDYVQTGRPILVVSSKMGASNDIISSNGGGIVVDSTSFEAITSALEELYSCWQKNTLDNLYSSDRLYHLFSPEVILAQYEDIFEGIGVAEGSNRKVVSWH